MKTKTRQTSKCLLFGAAVTLGTLAMSGHSGAQGEGPDEGQAKVQLAILLDTSGSMSGLIEQTKTQLWRIVNTFIDARQDGKVPYVEVALYEYGNDALDPESHWIRRIQPLTRDLDQISKDLFGLRTNGGSEFCGAVIRRAVEDLRWDDSPDVYKAIFVAGNEPFTQGPVEPAQACRDAIAKGVIVNTIHCGTETEGVNSGWKSGAVLADGKFLVIDHNKAVVHVDAPQDAELVRLNGELNKTYIPIGRMGTQLKARQVEQDANADAWKESGALVQRIRAKASANYCNSNWDLVDACATADFDWSKVKAGDLPEEMQGMTVEERKAHAAAKRAGRTEIQKQIQELNDAREEYVRAELQKRAGEDGETLDQVVVETVRSQAVAKGYAFSK